MREKFNETEEIKSNMVKGENAKRKDFVKLVNQLMLKMEASLINEGSDGYRNLTDFGERIISEIIENDEYKSKENEVNEDECFTIGMLSGQYSTTYSYDKEMDCDQEWEKYLDIEFLSNERVKLIVRDREYDETKTDEDVEKQYDSTSAVISIKELQEFCDSLPGLYPQLPEKMIAQGQFFDDNGRFSKNEIREFFKQKYIPGQFHDIAIVTGGGNYGDIHLNIPNGIATELTDDMFAKYKENLVEASIPFSVKRIDKGTFSNCPKLKKVVMCDITGEQDPFELFENCPNLENILIVPKDAEQYYDKYGSLRYGQSYRKDEKGEIHTSEYIIGENDVKYNFKKIRRNEHDISEIAETVYDRRQENINKVVSEISEAIKDNKKDNAQTKDD